MKADRRRPRALRPHDPGAPERLALALEALAELSTEHLPEEQVGDSTAGTIDRLALHRALGTLAPRQRAVIVLRYYEDLTEAQTANALGIAVGTVKSQTRDALRRLRETSPELTDLLVSP